MRLRCSTDANVQGAVQVVAVQVAVQVGVQVDVQAGRQAHKLTRVALPRTSCFRM